MTYFTKLSCILLFLSLCFVHAQPASDQRTGILTGTVIDASLSEPLPYVTVLVQDKERNTLLGGITDKNGDFKLEKVPVGTHNLRVQYIGYQTIERSVSIGGNAYSINLGNLLLQETLTELDEVEVIAEVSTIKQSRSKSNYH